ncbi:unnamed protein product [Rhizophagus irregularis]|nr:unnamed protein product [Rhizophagus irregularis]CAB5391084.1 unnamed protein product [Rhizophagus irregularis]
MKKYKIHINVLWVNKAIGAIAYDQLRRIDILLCHMVYLQQLMVKIKTIELVEYDKSPGIRQNAMVAVMRYLSYDIEDALVLNKTSVK